ncbi:MAG: hypothetical protein B9S34_11905 [Opitutia bacterium Tous-C1TDCM]|nr:MAG: hypothetical protein B9S34_11905 [Opitutae bacterium Tous-C1TDCM]
MPATASSIGFAGARSGAGDSAGASGAAAGRAPAAGATGAGAGAAAGKSVCAAATRPARLRNRTTTCAPSTATTSSRSPGFKPTAPAAWPARTNSNLVGAVTVTVPGKGCAPPIAAAANPPQTAA